jgi:hypothetical protein
MSAELHDPGGVNSVVNVFSNINYFPRLILAASKSISLSAGMPVNAGIAFYSDQYDGHTPAIWLLDIPAVIDLNIGCKSSNKNKQRFGGYLGAGLGYMFVNLKTERYATMQRDGINGVGPLYRAGFRAAFGRIHKRGITLGFFYKNGPKKDKVEAGGAQLLVDF